MRGHDDVVDGGVARLCGPGAGAEEMSRAMWNGDYRFLSIAREETENLTLDEVKYAISSQMTTDAVEVRHGKRCTSTSTANSD